MAASPVSAALAPNPSPGDAGLSPGARSRVSPSPGAGDQGLLFRRQTYVRRPKLGEILLEMGAVDASELARALILQRRLSARLGDVLLRRGLVSEETLAEALGRQRGMGQAGPAPVGYPAMDTLARSLPLHLALTFRALPWNRTGGRVLIATARPEALDDLRAALPPEFDNCLFAVVTDTALDARMHEVHGRALARAAECRVPEGMSCRLFRARPGAALLAIALLTTLLAITIWPAMALRIATAAGLMVMCANLGLRVAAVLALRRRGPGFTSVRPAEEAARKLPVITVLVPLHNEPDIAGPLTERLSRLDYPRELLDICLVVEEGDRATLDALGRATLPRWMRVVPVPDGQPRTKPRAMNYALNFARGDIVGIYDAEDAPAPDQLLTVATRFQAAPARVACLQGLLDYYNPTRNWMARCFTIEYANWFRLVLPGIARMGLVVPLGGTTLFFRRTALERIGAWDAHNVTEDADLGVRLARLGYRTEIINTTTLEEANASPLAWVKQRSRWMKGYILTWAVHSRRPVQLWRDLGPRRFFGFHLMFMGSILNALLMPALWSTVVIPFGVHHPIVDWLPGNGLLAIGIVMASGGLLSMSLAWIGCATPHHRSLRKWIPTLELYYPLATLAALKALQEIVVRPFHWDKTSHGHFGGADGAGIGALEQMVSQADGGIRPRMMHGG
ncbi:Cellulose synthase 1 [Jannaschia rubra]|uniref:Cellulose synthase 1 n=2 Tax=Jannaschia rubra TaxID=282197 RepID=A0A0M6XQD1_9RHOB|nr:Cellulose synthase 1 [Jannaschia rubra]SFG46270.1 Glycosyltransferase, catalytic subunit of cellulose synthase and poly-beta-1,6-N-acetylglucosamine synthase [Jannaschia rubra]